MAGLVSPPKTPKKPKPTVNPPLAGLIAPPKPPKRKPTTPQPLAGLISPPKVPQEKNPIDPEKVKEAVDKVLGKNYDAVA